MSLALLQFLSTIRFSCTCTCLHWVGIKASTCTVQQYRVVLGDTVEITSYAIVKQR